ncbi:MAG TPA: FAD-binding oxidoreductase, partial [Methanomassiliicoccales archaeon]|nr:FAD-binding oxidoreductase [Methanomassiliicoccales archaeon]
EKAQEAPASLVAKLEAAVGKENVKTSKMERLLYSHDLAPLPKETQIAFKNVPDVVVRPRSTLDVQKVVKIANEEGAPITPRGASSWGLGGSMPVFGGIVLDLAGGMSKIVDIDVDNLCCTVEAGASYKQVYDACLEKGLILGSYPSSFPSATIGGWIAKDGVGIGSYKYGGPGLNLRSMEVVMPDGNVVQTGFRDVADNSAGYNLNALMVGAEGTLGIITKVTLKLYPFGGVLKNVSYSFDDLKAISKPLWEICRSQVVPLHIGFSDGKHFEFLRKAGKHAPEVGTILNVAFDGTKEDVEREIAFVDAIVAKYNGKKMPEETGTHEWDERCYEFRSREVGLGNIPGEVVARLKDFDVMADGCYRLLYDLKLEGAIIGIMCDRNTVMFMPYYFLDTDDLMSMMSYSYNKKTSDLAFEHGGRPLGFGAFFAANLQIVRGKDAASEMKKIKDALDANEIMNPGKLLEMETRFGIGISSKMFELAMDGIGVAKKMIPRQQQFEDKAEVYESERAKKEKEEHRH